MILHNKFVLIYKGKTRARFFNDLVQGDIVEIATPILVKYRGGSAGPYAHVVYINGNETSMRTLQKLIESRTLIFEEVKN